MNEQACLPKGGYAFFPFRIGVRVFVHLHCHSHYSFLRATASPEEIVAAAAEQKMSAVALTDTNGLYAAVPFYQAAQKAQIKPIVGVTLDVEFQTANFASGHLKNEMHSSLSMPFVLLATDMEGYSNLCRLVTLRHLGTTKLAQNVGVAENREGPVTIAALAKHSKGVIALCPIARAPLNISSRGDAARYAPVCRKKYVAHLKNIFGDRPESCVIPADVSAACVPRCSCG